MKVQLLYFDGCPHWADAEAHLRQALRETGREEVGIEHVLVTTPEDAERWHFAGSPTVLIDGTDPFREPDAPAGLSCRVYRTGHGTTSGAPTVQQLTDVLCDLRELS